MDFNLSDKQTELQKSTKRFFDEKFSIESLRKAEESDEGFPRAIWDDGIRLGWAGTHLSEELGGGGGGLLDMCVLLEEIGRAGATLPLVTSSGVSATILKGVPQGPHRDHCLTDIAAGKIISPALIDEQSRNEWDDVRLPITADGDGYTLSGKKILVPFGSSADEFLVTAVSPKGEATLVVVDPSSEGISITRHHASTGIPMSSVAFNDVRVSKERVIGLGTDALTALHAGLQAGSLLATAEAIGLCEAIKKMTAEYVSAREAFGQPIGKFQAVSHPCADMHIKIEMIRILSQEAAWLADNGRNAAEEIGSTKALANEFFERIANDAFRFHGAFGYAIECDLQPFMRRVRAFCQTMGETHESLERAAQAVGI